jgi:hypothetical protein
VETKGFQKLDEGVELFGVCCSLFVVRHFDRLSASVWCLVFVVRCSLFDPYNFSISSIGKPVSSAISWVEAP